MMREDRENSPESFRRVFTKELNSTPLLTGAIMRLVLTNKYMTRKIVYKSSPKDHMRTLAFLVLNKKTGCVERINPGSFAEWCNNHSVDYNSVMVRRNNRVDRDVNMYTWVTTNHRSKKAIEYILLAKANSVVGF